MVVANQLLWVIQREKKPFRLGSQRKFKANNLKTEANYFMFICILKSAIALVIPSYLHECSKIDIFLSIS